MPQIYLCQHFIFQGIFTIKELPYIAVLDENNYFYGILTQHLIKYFSAILNVKQGAMF